MSCSKPEREKAAATAAKQVTCTAPFAATGIAVGRAPSSPPAVARPQKAPVLQKPEAIRLQRLEAWKRCPVGGPFNPRCMGARDANVQHLVLQGHHPGCCDPCLMRTKIPRATIDDCRPPSKRIGLYHISFLSSLVSSARNRLRLPARCPHVCMADTSRSRLLTLDNKDWIQPPTPIAAAAAAAAKCHSSMKGAEG